MWCGPANHSLDALATNDNLHQETQPPTVTSETVSGRRSRHNPTPAELRLLPYSESTSTSKTRRYFEAASEALTGIALTLQAVKSERTGLKVHAEIPSARVKYSGNRQGHSVRCPARNPATQMLRDLGMMWQKQLNRFGERS